MKFKCDNITEHFRLSEFSCSDELYLSPEFVNWVVNVIEPFRQWYNRPININSCYRTKAKNIAVGGDYNSLHLRAMAIDFNLPADWASYSCDRKNVFLKNIKTKWFDLCKSNGGYGQMTVHESWLHLGQSRTKEYYDDRR